MGEETANAQPGIWLGRIALNPVEGGYEDIVDLIGDHYGITHRAELYKLAEDLVEIGCVAQWRGEGELGDLRNKGRAAAIAVRDAACRLQAAIDELNEQAIEFARITQWSPHLLEEIFDLSGTRPTGVSIFPIPDEISGLEQLSRRRGYWAHVRKRFDGLAVLPVKEAVPGRVPNIPLQHAVMACRALWEGAEGRDWGFFKLKDRAVRNANCIADLKNECEQFVANMLAACGVGFDLKRLHSAWVSAAAKGQNMQGRSTT